MPLTKPCSLSPPEAKFETHVALASFLAPRLQQVWRLSGEMAAEEEGTGRSPEASCACAASNGFTHEPA